ncbi:MAG: hypothetical protein JNK72_23310 [Myxococcales bacterium]|nr:hypothetical protein [Myxococcales bacterium]
MRGLAKLSVLISSIFLAHCGGEALSGQGGDAGADGATAVDTPATSDAPMDAGSVDPGDTGPVVGEDAGPGWVPDARSPDTPIEAPADTWTWVPFADSACGNGTPAGIGVNLHPGSRQLMVFFMGGGGCWDAATCYGLGTAEHIQDTYNDALFRREIGSIGQAFVFNRTSQLNPLREANWVFVPYCTGDIHGGDRVAQYQWNGRTVPTYHVGARNVDAYLRRLVRTLPTVNRVLVTGISAGGYGAGVHWSRIADAFPGARVDLVDDSGPPMAPPNNRWNQWRRAWNLQLPEGCTTCTTQLETLIDFYSRRFPSPARMALLSYTQDRTISGFYGILPAAFESGLRNLATTQFEGRANMKYFFLAGSNHVLLGNPLARGANGTTLAAFLGQMLSDDPNWQSVSP